ncbi:MAG: TolC family protein [Desmonostoc vinosum HA7617-LM4]|nr:TolC family protein [Desmonostoc vinosum HA7617-LM4]
MKGQQLFHSFLPGVTAAVVITQPAWAGTVKVGGVQLASSPNVLTSTYSQNLVADITNTQRSQTRDASVPTQLPTAGLTRFHMQPLSYNSIPVVMTGSTVVPLRQVLKKDKGKFFSLTSAEHPTFGLDENRSTKSNLQLRNLGTSQKKLESVVISDSAAKPTAVSSSRQPLVSKKNSTATELRTFLGTSATPTAAKLLVVQRCLQEMNKSNTTVASSLLLSSSTCSQQNAIRKRLAQSNIPTAPADTPQQTPTTPGTVTPAPTDTPQQTPTTPGTVTPAPTGTQQVPDNLIQSPNPLQFPTKPEEVTVQGNQPITLGQALELARRNNRDLQVSILELERSRGALREQQAALLPTLGISADISRSQSASTQLSIEQQEQATGISQPEEATTAFNGQAELSYNIYTSGRRQALIREAEERVRVSELSVENQSEEIRLNVATEYYDLQQADEQVRIAQSAVENAEASLRDAQALERAGVGTRFDVLRSQVNLANAQQDLTNARSQQAIARRRLATRLSLPQSVNISTADPVQLAGLWNLSLEQSIVQAYQNRPELQQQLAQRNISEQQRRQALGELGPQVSLIASYNLLDQFDDTISVTDGYSLGVRATLNLYDGGAAKARAAQARSNIAIAETQFAEQRNQIRFQVEDAFSTQQSNLENVQTSNAALEQAREALRLARLRFQAGVGTQTDVINSENDLTRAEGNRVTAILDYNRALARLQRAVTARGLR